MSKFTNPKKEIANLASGEDNDELNRSGSDLGINIKRFPLKIGFLGDSYVGKTCIISRFVNNTFDKEKPCTVSAYFESKKLKIDPFNEADLKIWDTAGSEKYRSMAKNYLRDSDGIVFVFDLSNKTSFDDLDSWVDEIKDIVDDKAVRILAGNKCDLSDIKVTREEINKYAEEKNMRYLEVSAKEGINIESLFEILATNCIKNAKQLLKKKEEEGLNKLPNLTNLETKKVKLEKEVEEIKTENTRKCC